ncbi:MAG: extracellular solute-binding protein, partial [bacterium]
MANYIFQSAPKLDWAAAPFPTVRAGDPPVTFAGSDMLMIPRGAKHPREAFEFIAYVNRQGPMERLCLSHRKNSPLRKVSESFLRTHKNPYIRMFQRLAWSRNAVHAPKMSVWNEYGNEISNAVEQVWLTQKTPAEALGIVKARIQKAWDRDLAKKRQLAAAKPSRWLTAAPFLVAGAAILAVLLVAAMRESARRRGEPAGARRRGGRGREHLLEGLPQGD